MRRIVKPYELIKKEMVDEEKNLIVKTVIYQALVVKWDEKMLKVRFSVI